MTTQIIFSIAAAVLLGLGISYMKRHYHYSLEQKYILRLIQLILILFIVFELIHAMDPGINMQSLLLNSSALIVAILGFAAQPVIVNIICGLLISFQKPFEIGDRIQVEGQQAGIVEDITLRHTVLRIYDGLRIIIPNGELNSKTLTNFSYGMKDRRGIYLQFSVSYDTEVEKAVEVIRDCVAASPYTLGIVTDGVAEDSGPVYFLEMGDSALVLSTTIWISRETNTQKAISDVNLRVLNAFREYGIEIPYPYFNVVEFEGSKTEAEPDAHKRTPAKPVTRHRRSETVRMQPGESRVMEALEASRHYAQMQGLPDHSALQLELLTEESVDLFQRIMNHALRDYWVEGTNKLYRIHIRANVRIDSIEEYKNMLALSSSGRNEAANNINKRILEAMLMGRQRILSKKSGSKTSFEWKLSDSEITEDEIGRSILAKVANDVRISVMSDWVELIVLKTVE